MKRKHVNLVILFVFFIACDAVEDIIKPTKAPEVSAIQSDKGFSVDLGDTITFSVTATNPEEGELSYKWSATGGTYIGSTQETSFIWKATGGGTFEISVDVSNNDKTTSQSKEIIVISPNNPFVNIIKPKTGDFLVEGTTVDIEIEAIHINGISEVFVEINDSSTYRAQLQSQNIYTYAWKVTGSAGETELKVIAHSTTGAIGAQSILVTIEGILPGKADD